MAASETFPADRIWLNGVEESIENPRLQNVLKASMLRLTEPVQARSTDGP